MKRLLVGLMCLWGVSCVDPASDSVAPSWAPDARLMLNAAETSVSYHGQPPRTDRAVTAYLVAIDGRTVAELSSEVLTFTIDALMPAQRYAHSTGSRCCGQ